MKTLKDRHYRHLEKVLNEFKNKRISYTEAIDQDFGFIEAEIKQFKNGNRPCPRCDGDGWYPDHDKGDPHENGCSNCPVQEQCEVCRAEGWITVEDLKRIREEQRQKNIEGSDPLPF